MEETRHSFPAIAAHVTAYARQYLWRLMETAGVGNYYYCDTDSLFVNRAGYANLTAYLDNDRLGGLKVEKQVQELRIFGLKDYVADDKITLKGIRRNAVQITATRYRQEQWPSLQGLLVAADTQSYTTISREKNLYRDYRKGLVKTTGEIVPFLLAVADSPEQPSDELPF